MPTILPLILFLQVKKSDCYYYMKSDTFFHLQKQNEGYSDEPVYYIEYQYI